MASNLRLIYNVRGPAGPASTIPGPMGDTIVSITRTAGDGSSGSVDTYTVLLSDGSTTDFQVYNGTDGVDGATGPAGVDGIDAYPIVAAEEGTVNPSSLPEGTFFVEYAP